MKNNIAITTLALAILTPASMAEKLPARIASQRIAPMQSPAAARAMPRVPMPTSHPGRQAFVPGHAAAKPIPSSNIQLRNHPAVARNVTGGMTRVGRNPMVKPGASTPGGISAGKAESIRQGAGIASGLERVGRLRPAGFGNDLPNGLPNTSGNGAGIKQPSDPFAENTITPRTPKAPDHITSNFGGNGLTDIRGGRDNSRKGTPGSTRDLTTTTERVTDSSSRGVFGSGSGSTASGPVVVNQDEETGEFVASQTGTNANGNQARIDVVQNTDENGRVTGTTEIVTQSDGESVSQRTVVRDSTGFILSDKTEKTTPGTRSCDRSTGDVAMGGPVGAGAAAVTGLVPLDLLRQPSGNESSGGTNMMTSGRLNRNHVNPGSRNDMIPAPGAKRNNIDPTRSGLSGPTSGGSAGGGDLPD